MPQYFLEMIQLLRREEHILLYANLLDIPDAELAETVNFLELEYKTESLSYPYLPPPFEPEAAAWAAVTIYRAAQLMLYRQHTDADLPRLFPDFQGPVNPGNMLSADLTLRFLPSILTELRHIDAEDPLNAILQGILERWPYSAISYDKAPHAADLSALSESACLRQLFADRVIHYKKKQWLHHTLVKDSVMGSVGNFGAKFWPDLSQIIQEIHE